MAPELGKIEAEIATGTAPSKAVAIVYAERRDAQEYKPSALPTTPESVSAATINSDNAKYWGNAPQ